MPPKFIKWIDQNCSKCKNFTGDIQLKTDDVLVMHFTQEIRLKCIQHGEIQNDKLYVCQEFTFDATKPEIIYNERRATKHDKRFFMRVGTPLPCDIKRDTVSGIDAIDEMTRLIYNLVQKVYIDHGMSSMLTFVIARVHKNNGYSHDAIFRCCMSMVEKGYLVRSQAGKFVELMLPPVAVPIADLKKGG